MQGIRRKRVTRVGSGAYSIYLPKRWIDGWGPEQRERREVDLHLINNSLLIVPALRRRSLEAAVPPERGLVRLTLLSAYLRGHHEARLVPSVGAFDEETVAMARDFLRHLDERLLTTVGPQAIGFHLQESMAPVFASGDDLLHLMATKLREMVGLAADCVEAYGTRPERALHTARLLHSLQEEDLSRLYHQAIRLVANLELPLGTVSDFQLLDLVAAEMQAVGAQCVAVAQAVVAGQGIDPAELERPRGELARKPRPPEPPHPAVAAIVRAYRRSFDDARATLVAFATALQARDAAALLAVGAACAQAQAELNRRIFATVREVAGRSEPIGADAFAVYQVRHALGALLAGLARAAERAASLSAAQGERPAAGADPSPRAAKA